MGEGDDLIVKAPRLRDHVGVICAHGAHDELRDADGTQHGYEAQHILGATDGEKGARVDIWAEPGREGLGIALDDRLVPATEAEGKAGAVVVVVDGAAERG